MQVIKTLSQFKRSVVVLNAYSLTPAAKIEHGDKLNQIFEKTTRDVEEKLNFHSSCVEKPHRELSAQTFKNSCASKVCYILQQLKKKDF